MTRAPGTHAYICECRWPSCRERLYLKPSTYRRLALGGTVVSVACARRDDLTVLASYGLYVVALSTGPRIRVDSLGATG